MLNSREEQTKSVRQECWAEATNVKADARLEQRHILCHDPLLNVKPLNTDAKEWHMLSPAVDEGTAESVIPDLLIDHPICETQTFQNGLNCIYATGEPRRATITLITRVSRWTQSCILQLWLVRLEQRHQRKSIGCARKTVTTWTCGSFLHHGCNTGPGT